MMHDTVYIRMLEGVETFIPVEVEHLADNNVFKIIHNKDMDLDSDATCIYEFFPGDIVECEMKKDYYLPINQKKKSFLLASKLISSSFPARRLHQLIFMIVKSFGKISISELQEYSKEIQRLCEDKSIMQRNHPIVQTWLANNCSTIR